MMFPEDLPSPSIIFYVLFVSLVLATLMAFVSLVVRAYAKVPVEAWPFFGGVRAAVPCTVVLTLTFLVSYSGVLQHWDLVPPPIFYPLCVFLAVNLYICTCTAFGGQLAKLPLWLLVGFQAFRLPVELLLHLAYNEGFAPIQITFQGRNFDIVTAVLAIGLAVWALLMTVEPPAPLLWIFNIAGLALLINVFATALLSMPTRFRVFMNEPSCIWVTFPPFIWLPTVLVQLALAFHLLLFRRLVKSGSQVEGDQAGME